MSILGDYHTHTVYSHGCGSIEDNVRAAIKAGLKEVAITDHGFFHGSYGVRRMDLPEIRGEIKRLRIKYPEIKIFLGVEANLIDCFGGVDIEEEDEEWLDILVCGYHKNVNASSTAEFFNYNLPNLLGGVTKFTSKQIVKNTDAYIKALGRYKIDIISHPNYGIKTDVVEIAKAAAHYGTFMELNGKKVSMTDQEIENILKTDVTLIVNSDGHSAERVGCFEVPFSYVNRLNIPTDRIANFDKIPSFRRYREELNGRG